MEWQHYGLAVMTGLITAALVSAFWLWLAPPTVQNQLGSLQETENKAR
jgi:membrane-associated phospholipid phosphatase